ncbi:hypothetical protein [Campylobacter lanienae]|uniref:hypothetical protein n=1 Tax=Campylobacter lanienae TaxID=75658 RepID=UPI00242AF5AE|nr:hypothetical protein [Campylobacter lanienae]MDD7514242.1 hypothetical protein [Campylobacter lanienae]MDY5520081.1 hypothetical protein [Campylobacter lanienae]
MLNLRLKEKLAGTILLCALVPLAVIGYIYIAIVGTFGDPTRARQGVRALDHFVNATIFNGYAWESVSSHAWRVRHKRWAKIVIFITDKFQKNHCQRANKREQPIIDLMLSRRLNEQTIGKIESEENG